MNLTDSPTIFVNELANKYTALFDVYRDQKIENFSLPFIAIYRRRDERYMISKKFKVYGVENQQIVFTTLCEKLTTSFVEDGQATMERNISKYIPEVNEHMSTTMLGIIITNQDVDGKILKEVRRYRKVKFIKFGLHGWIELYTVVINLKDNSLNVHPKGKSFVESIEKMLNEEVKV